MSEPTNQTEAGEREDSLNVIPVSSLEAIQRAEVDIAIATAKRWPRDISRSLKTCRELALRNQSIAATCNYVVPRGGKKLVGPSVHFARIVSYSWGNNTAIARVVGCDRDNAHVQGVFHDLQTNSRIGIEMDWPVQPPRDDTPERWKDQMNLAKRAGSAVALRTAIFNCVPMVLFDDISQEAKLVGVGQGKSFEESRSNAIRICKEKGITQPQLYQALNVGGLESITIDHLIYLNALLQSVADGTMTFIEAFGKESTAPVKAQVPSTPKKAAPPPEPSSKEQPTPQQANSAQPAEPAKPEQKEPPKEEKPPAEKPKTTKKPAPSERPPESTLVDQVRAKLKENGIEEQTVINWMDALGVVKHREVKLDDVAPKWLHMLINKWEENLQHLKPSGRPAPAEEEKDDFPA